MFHKLKGAWSWEMVVARVQEPCAECLALDRLCRKGCFAQDTRAIAILFVLGTSCVLFFADVGENGFSHHSVGSQNPEVLNAAKTRQQKTTADLQA